MRLSKILPLFLIFSVIVSGIACGALVVVNPRDVNVVLHPNETHTYYYINGVIGSTTPIFVTSRYIVISGVSFSVDSDAPVYVHINKWNVENVNKPGVVLFNYTVSTLYHNQTVTFSFANLPDVPLIVYKDGKPFMLALPNTKVVKLPGNKTVKMHYFSFSDGLKVAKELYENTSFCVSKGVNASKCVTVRGKVVKVKHIGSSAIVVIKSGNESIQVQVPGVINISTGKTVVVQGIFSNMWHMGRFMHMRRMYFMRPGGFSTHVYVVETASASLKNSESGSSSTSDWNTVLTAPLPKVSYVGYIVIASILLPVIVAAYLAFNRYKGM